MQFRFNSINIPYPPCAWYFVLKDVCRKKISQLLMWIYYHRSVLQLKRSHSYLESTLSLGFKRGRGKAVVSIKSGTCIWGKWLILKEKMCTVTLKSDNPFQIMLRKSRDKKPSSLDPYWPVYNSFPVSHCIFSYITVTVVGLFFDPG